MSGPVVRPSCHTALQPVGKEVMLMSKQQKTWAVLVGAVAVQVVASRYAKQQAAALGLPAVVALALPVLVGAALR